MTKDMTSGSPLKLILSFSIPLLIGNLFQQFYSMVDTIIVGRFLGVDALAAVGSTGSMTFLILGLVLGLASGFSVLVAQRFGANDTEGLNKAIGTSYLLSIICSIIITIFSCLLAKPLLNITNTPANIYDDAYKYLIVIFIGCGANFFYNTISSLLRALGDSKTPLYFLIVASILNIILDIVFIVNFKMGVEGAAYATVISQGVSAVLCLMYVYKKLPILKLQRKYMTFDMEYIKGHLSIAIPMALQFSVTAVGTVILQSAVNSFGSAAVGAFTAANKVEQLVMQPPVTFGITMATYVAQNLGSNNIERIKDGVSTCVKINVLLGVFAFIVLNVYGEDAIKLFIDNPDEVVIGYSMDYLRTAAMFFIPLSLIFVYRNALQSMGYSSTALYAGGLELIARAIVAVTLPSLIGFLGVCFAGPFAWVSAFAFLCYHYYKTIRSFENNEVYQTNY